MSDWTWTQAERLGQIATMLGPDKVLLESFYVAERFSEPFSITAHVLSQDLDVDFTPLLGTGVSIVVSGGPSVARPFHGVLFEASLEGIEGGTARYRLLLRPWISLLGLGRNSRIFQKKAVKDIVDSVIKGAGFTDYSIDLSSRGLAPREYCVQFRESDLNFISRLMEEEGIYYFFQHSGNSHKLIILDDPSKHPDFPETVQVFPSDDANTRDAHLWSWGTHVQPALNKVSLRDFNFQKATEILKAENQATSENPADKSEFYDYPDGFGAYADDGSVDGTPYAVSRVLASRGVRNVHHGEGDVFAVPVGSRVPVETASATAKFLIYGATYSFSGQNYIGSDSGEPHFQVQLEAVTADTSWRPERRTYKPLAGGPQTAIVVGAAGEVIEVDKFGRIHVQFPWDRQGQSDSNSSCWLRVSQSSAGGGFGHMHIPRIGEEVIVDFLEGDPDRPIVTGRVYNASQMPPYPLPDDKTKSTWKSQTIGASGDYSGAENPPSGTGFNEIRFEDKGGSEEVFVYAQRDMNAWYRHDESRKTGRDTSVRVGRNRETSIKNNETLTIETGDETRTLQQGSRKTTIEKADTVTLNSGDYSLTVSSGQATIEAMQQITLKVGSNQIVISQQGVEITGLTVKATATTSLAMQGLTSDFKADTMVTINGLMVNIN